MSNQAIDIFDIPPSEVEPSDILVTYLADGTYKVLSPECYRGLSQTAILELIRRYSAANDNTPEQAI